MIIKGNKVNLRPLTLRDAPRLVLWTADPEVYKFLSFDNLTLKQERQWIKSIRYQPGEHHFAIETKDNVHIGVCGLSVDSKQKNASFGIFIGDKNYWNIGLGTETTKLLLKHGFNKLKLSQITLKVYNYNVRAMVVYENCGFKHEKTLPRHRLWQGRYYDALIMTISRDEWLQR